MNIGKNMSKARSAMAKTQKKAVKNEIKHDKEIEKREAKRDTDYKKRLSPEELEKEDKRERDHKKREFDDAFSPSALNTLANANLTYTDIGFNLYQYDTPIHKVRQASNLLDDCRSNDRRVKADEIKLLFSDEYTHEQQDAIYEVLDACYCQSKSDYHNHVQPSFVISPDHTAKEMREAADIIEHSYEYSYEDSKPPYARDKIKAVFAVTELKKMDKVFTPEQMKMFDQAIEEGFGYRQLMAFANPDLNSHQMNAIFNAAKEGVPVEKIELFAKPEFDAFAMEQYALAYTLAAMGNNTEEINKRIETLDNLIDSKFSSEQLHIILPEVTEGYIDSNNIKLIANPKFSPKVMEAMVECFQDGMKRSDVMEMVNSKVDPEQMKVEANDCKIEARIDELLTWKRGLEVESDDLRTEKAQNPERWSAYSQEKLDGVNERIKDINESLEDLAEQLSPGHKKMNLTKSSTRSEVKFNGIKSDKQKQPGKEHVQGKSKQEEIA